MEQKQKGQKNKLKKLKNNKKIKKASEKWSKSGQVRFKPILIAINRILGVKYRFWRFFAKIASQRPLTYIVRHLIYPYKLSHNPFPRGQL